MIFQLHQKSILLFFFALFYRCGHGFLFSPQRTSVSTIDPSKKISTTTIIHPSFHKNGGLTQCFGFTRDKAGGRDKSKKKKTEKGFKKLQASNDLMTQHQERLSTAGKEGTLRFVDPTKVFLGNLNFTATEEDIRHVLEDQIVPTKSDIRKINIVRDWKTGDSKGYAFLTFTQPIFATLCITQLHGKKFMGRHLKVTSVNSRSESPLRKKQREELLRQKELRKALQPPQPPPKPKYENPSFLGTLDPDLIVPSNYDDSMFEEEDDDPEVDGWEIPGAPAPKGFG